MSKTKSDYFLDNIREAIETSVLKLVQSGDWCKIDYQQRINVDTAFLRDVYAGINRERLKALLSERIELKIIDSLVNSMATEIATDVKQILGNKELREDLRSLVRDKIRAVSEPVTT